MATLRQFIRDMTGLPVGSTIRASIENPKVVGGGETKYIGQDIDLMSVTTNIDMKQTSTTIDLLNKATNVDIIKRTTLLDLEIDGQELDLSNNNYD